MPEVNEPQESAPSREPALNLRRGFGWLALSLPIICVSWWFFDRPVEQWSRETGVSLRPASEIITESVEALWPLITSAVWCAVAYAFKRFNLARWALLMILAILGSGIAVNILKFIFARARPALLKSDEWGFQWLASGHEYASFPSGHATTAGAIAMTLCLMVPRLRFGFIVLGCAAASTRVILNAHYLGDVAAGWILGCFCVFFIDWVWWKRWGNSLPIPYLRKAPTRAGAA